MHRSFRLTLISLITASLVLATACTDQGNKGSMNAPRQNAVSDRDVTGGNGRTGTISGLSTQGRIGVQGPVNGNSSALSGQSGQMLTQDGVLPIEQVKGKSYVDAQQLSKLLGFHSRYDRTSRSLAIGDNDAAFELKVDSNQARKEDNVLTLKTPPIMENGRILIPTSALGDLLAEDASFSQQGRNIVFRPSQEPLDLKMDQDSPIPLSDALNFGEDPSDPFKNAVGTASTMMLPDEDTEEVLPAAALKNINIPAMISRSRKYLGVRYVFGAKPYPQSGVFDCSSYTRYIFGKYGVYLPRTARAQAKLGNTVSRTSLRVGDLLYFYVPGRFKVSKTVGHVGIYIGNYRMINASPAPKDGVQIININKAYWKRTYLFAKRMVY